MKPESGDAEGVMPEATTGASVARGAAWTVAARTIPQLQILALSVAAAHYLGPSDMGRQSFIAFVSGSALILATAGLPAALSRFVAELTGARRGGVARSLFWWTWRVEALTGGLAAVALAMAALLGASPRGAWLLVAAGCAFGIMQTVPSSLLTGSQRWRDVTLAGMVTGVAAVPLTILVLALGGGIPGYFAVETATIAANLLWVGTLGRRVLVAMPPRAEVPRDYRTRYLQFAGATTVFVAIDLIVWRRSEFIFLAAYSNNVQIALYSIAFAASTALTRMPGAVTSVLTPAVASLAGAGEHGRIRSGYWRVLRTLTLVTPVVAAGAAAVGPQALELIYGHAYAGVRPIMLLLVAPLPVMPLIAAADGVLFALGKLRFLLIVGLSATVVNIGLDFLLVPAFDGVGAALANVGAQLASGIPVLVYTNRLFRPSALPAGVIWRSVGVAAAVGGAAYGVDEALGGPVGVVAGIVAGVLACAGAARLLRPMTREDAEWVESLGSGRVAVLLRRVAEAVSR